MKQPRLRSELADVSVQLLSLLKSVACNWQLCDATFSLHGITRDGVMHVILRTRPSRFFSVQH